MLTDVVAGVNLGRLCAYLVPLSWSDQNMDECSRTPGLGTPSKILACLTGTLPSFVLLHLFSVMSSLQVEEKFCLVIFLLGFYLD